MQTRLKILILQHPQEPDKELGTAHLVRDVLPGCQITVALSRANLAHALGLPRGEVANPKRWAVLYLGSGVKGAAPKPTTAPVLFVDKKGAPLLQPPEPSTLDGIVVLDGTWSQAKALWWRNAWLLKLWRMILLPGEPSRYGKLRREPRSDAISTLESIGRAITGLGENPEVQNELLARFDAHLKKFRN